MFCRECGTKVVEGAKFCTVCGTEVAEPRKSSYALPFDGAAAIGARKKAEDVVRRAKSAFEKSSLDVSVAEGALSIVLGIMVPLVPAIKIDYYIGGQTLSMLDAVTGLSRIRELLGEYQGIIILLGFLMIVASLGSFLNARDCFMGKVVRDRVLFGSVRVTSTTAGAVAGYAVVMLLGLWYVSGQSYGVVAGTGWLWLLLMGGVTSVVLERVRRATEATRTC
ncbi:MAG: zinc ribbon domain-containing protein [Atopobiaceae bacterium]|nr:zinc ribbon domain-containing protein [Atopobiaceae bacterium]